MSNISNRIQGIALLNNRKSIFSPRRSPIRNLDKLPFPDRSNNNKQRLQIHLMETSRGCPHACSFCETTRFNGARWRAKSPMRVVDEIEDLVTNHDARIIHIVDDSFASSPRRVIDISRTLHGRPMPDLIMVSARADDLSRNNGLLPAIAKMGIRRISVGVESLNDGVRSAVGKQISVKSYEDVFKSMRLLRIFSVASIIVGLPHEPVGRVVDTVARAVSYGFDSVRFIPYWPLPQTPLASDNDILRLDPRHVSAASEFTKAFHEHPYVIKRLAEAAKKDDIYGVLAQTTLDIDWTKGPSANVQGIAYLV